MKNSQKSFSLILLVAVLMALIVGGYFLFKQNQGVSPAQTIPDKATTSTRDNATTSSSTESIHTYIGSGFSFEYSTALSITQDASIVTLTHSIPYKHANACDFKGDAPALPSLTDFDVSLKVVNKDVKSYVESAGGADWSYVSQNPYSSGGLDGYHITQGVEGCGQEVYYLSVSQNKTAVITRTTVAEFSPINAEYKKYLALPGVIPPPAAEEYFSKILASFVAK